jgi:hypothetical protein
MCLQTKGVKSIVKIEPSDAAWYSAVAGVGAGESTVLMDLTGAPSSLSAVSSLSVLTIWHSQSVQSSAWACLVSVVCEESWVRWVGMLSTQR